MLIQTKYITEKDPEAFVDFPPPAIPPEGNKTCGRCQGHGGWNLLLNQYPLWERANTPENRHMYAHFRCMCGSCWGFGYVPESQTCMHEWRRDRTIRMCWHVDKCIHCGLETEVDSSG